MLENISKNYANGTQVNPSKASPPCDNRPLMHTWHGNKWSTWHIVCTNHGFAYK